MMDQEHGKVSSAPTLNKPSIHIAMPCYDSVKIRTMISIVRLVKELTAAGLKFELNTMQSPYVAYARNILTVKIPSKG